jgi:hypothetical protein
VLLPHQRSKLARGAKDKEPIHPRKWILGSASNCFAQRSAKPFVMLDVPLAAHGFVAGLTAFGIEQNPFPPLSRLGAETRIVLAESSLYVRDPADISSTIIVASASEHIDETAHARVGEWLNQTGVFARWHWVLGV